MGFNRADRSKGGLEVAKKYGSEYMRELGRKGRAKQLENSPPAKTYEGIHNWLRTNCGKASKCNNILCKKDCKHFQWSLLKGKKYESKKENFTELCRLCHLSYDDPEGGFKNRPVALKEKA